MLLTAKHLGQDVPFNTIEEFKSKTTAIHQKSSTITKFELMRLIGSMDFYFKYNEKLLVNKKLLIYSMIMLGFTRILNWKHFFNKNQSSNTKVVTLTLPNKNHPFFKTVKSSLISELLKAASQFEGKIKESGF